MRFAIILATCLALGLSAQAAESRYARLPLTFEPNVGQAPLSAQYVARGARYSVRLERTGPVLLSREGEQFALGFPGSKVQDRGQVGTPLAATTNYLLGNKPAGWHRKVANFASVRYAQLYPGIDIVYYGQDGSLEYDFEIAPQADPSAIRIRGGKARLNGNGDLTFEGSEFSQHRPVAYQMRDGQRRAVEVEYSVLANGDVALQLGEYDHARELIVDPTLGYASYFGGSGNDAITSIKVDATGALFATGFTTSTNFKTTAGALQTTYKGRGTTQAAFAFGDAFVAKFSPSGALVYSTYFGGTDDEMASAIAIDAAGNAYVAGATRSQDFPVSAGAFQSRFGGSAEDFFFSRGDVFVAKFSPDGSRIVYATYIGGSLNEGAWGIVVDGSGNVTVVGDTLSTNFPTTTDAISRNFRGSANSSIWPSGDGFIAKLNATGASLTYGTYIGGQSHDLARSVALDSQGNAYVCGYTFSSNFPTTAGAYQTAFRGVETSNYDLSADDGWVLKLSPQNTVVYSTYLGGSNRDSAFGIAVDATGNAYVTGRSRSIDFPVTAGAVRSTYGGSGANGNANDIVQGDAFVAKLNPAGSGLLYATYLGGAGDDIGAEIVTDAAGNIYVTGFTLSGNFPVSADALQKTFAGFGGQGFDIIGAPPPAGIANTGDAFVSKLSAQGALVYSSYFGGTQDDGGYALALDSAGNIYVGGNTLSPALALGAGAVQSAYGGTGTSPRGDGFLAKFDFGGRLAGAPAKVSFTSSSPTSGSVSAALAAPVVVEVLDAANLPLAGVTVTFSGTNATANPSAATTGADGRAATTVTLGSTLGAARVTASVAGLASIQLDLSVNPAGPVPTISAVVNGASFLPVLAPGSWLTVGGAKLNSVRADATSVPMPTTLGGVRVRVNGSLIPLLVVLENQINAQLPYSTPLGNATLTVEVNGVVSASFPFTVSATAPGIFLFGNNRAVAQNVALDGTLTVNTSDNPIAPGRSMIVYITGQGALDNPVADGDFAGSSPLSRPRAAYSITVGTKPVVIDFLGMTPGQISLVQANIRIPADLTAGDYPVVVTIGGQASNGPSITIKP
ncbi:MAG: SBBP repeat-containing protein [Bryobacteraceae bacterium]